MLKRIATLLLGIGLIGFGVLFFIAPQRAFAVQLLTRYWPLFLILAGLVRVAGYLIDRHPRSPVGGLMISAIGGILLAANWRGENSFVLILGNYWFWLLMALIIGRVMRQYAHRPEEGPRPSAFAPGTIVLMAIIVGCGLTANYLAKKNRYMNVGIARFNGMRDFILGSELTVEDEPAQTFPLLPNSRLIINNLSGDIEISASPQQQASARIIKRMRAINEEEAKQVGQNIHLQISSSGNTHQFSVNSPGVQQEYSVSIVIALPQNAQAGVEVLGNNGQVKLSGLRGDHTIRDSGRSEIGDNTGRITIDNPRGPVELRRINGEVSMTDTRRGVEMNDIVGAIKLDIKGGNVSINRVSGTVQARVADARIELNEVAKSATDNGAQRIISLDDVRNSRVKLQEVKGAVAISAQRSRIDAEAIDGDLTINTSFERVITNRIKGSLRVNAEDATVEIEDIKGSAIVETTRDVTVRNFHGPLNITTRLGTINLETDEKITGEIKAVSGKGKVRVSLPEDSGFRIDAVSNFGRVRVRGFDQINTSRKERSAVMGYNISDSAPLVSLRTENGDIQLQSSGLALARSEDE